MKDIEKHQANLFSNNIHKLKKYPAYIVIFWWQTSTIVISNSKKTSTQLQYQYPLLKPLLKIVVYKDRSRINEK